MLNTNKSSFSLKKRFINSLWIYPKFQMSLILLNFIILLTAFAVLIIQNYYIFSKLHKMGDEAGMSKDHPFHQFVQFQENQFLFFTSITFVIVLLLLSWASLLLSHRVAGPIMRLKSYFTGIQSTGKITKLQFRKNDYFDDLPIIINNSLESIIEKKESSS